MRYEIILYFISYIQFLDLNYRHFNCDIILIGHNYYFNKLKALLKLIQKPLDLLADKISLGNSYQFCILITTSGKLFGKLMVKLFEVLFKKEY